MEWISRAEREPSEGGKYWVFAPSADEDKPFYAVAWFEPPDSQHMKGWQMLPAMWCEAITHWAECVPPKE